MQCYRLSVVSFSKEEALAIEMIKLFRWKALKKCSIWWQLRLIITHGSPTEVWKNLWWTWKLLVARSHLWYSILKIIRFWVTATLIAAIKRIAVVISTLLVGLSWLNPGQHFIELEKCWQDINWSSYITWYYWYWWISSAHAPSRA